MELEAMMNTFELGGGQGLHFTADEKVPRVWNHGFHYRMISRVSDEDAAGFKITADHGRLLACKDIVQAAERHRRHRGTRHKAIFGFADADVQAREHGDLFGVRDMGRHRITSLFGCEDTTFQLGERGRKLFGGPDLDTGSSRKAREVFGRADAHGGKYDTTRHIFGDEMVEDSDEEDYFESNAGVIFIRGVEGEVMLKKDIRHEHGAENLLNSLDAIFSKETLEGEENVKRFGEM